LSRHTAQPVGSRPAATYSLSRRGLLRLLSGTALGLALAGRASPARAAEPGPAGRLVAFAGAGQAEDVLTPAGRSPGQLSPLITPSSAFYVVTKNAGGDPQLEPGAWRLIVDGQVNSPVQVDYQTLQQLPAVEVVKTLECISNFTAKCELASFGCDLISTAVWRGARLSDLFDLAGGLRPSATSLTVVTADEFTSSVPIEAALDAETLLVYEMNSAPLPAVHGFPARVVVPGRYGFKSAKWVVQLSPRAQPVPDWYGQRHWSLDGIVKTMTRIDTPAPGAELAAGRQPIGGIAYAGSRGVQAVEFSPDSGATWQAAELVEPAVGRDAWVRWQGAFDLAAGQETTLVGRAIDGSGALQIERFSLPQPDGGSGWHSITVRGR
jgi:DMSO/TMAO reductase YedYZ molybdopterin-dependent catalytic subunit